jgi:hypothetical protein
MYHLQFGSRARRIILPVNTFRDGCCVGGSEASLVNTGSQKSVGGSKDSEITWLSLRAKVAMISRLRRSISRVWSRRVTEP